MEKESTLDEAFALLREAGIRVAGGNLSQLSLTMPDGSTRELKVYFAATPPTPSKLEALLESDARLMIVVNRPSRTLKDAAHTDRVDFISTTPASVIISGVERLDRQDVPARATASGRPAWGRWAMLRALALTPEPMTQLRLADAVGISQPAVNKNLKDLIPLAIRGEYGWEAESPSEVVSEWERIYPGPRGASTYWYSLQPPMTQAEEAALFATKMGASPLISGDIAADTYAPWSLPGTVQLYVRQAVDFVDAGFTPSTKDEATMTVTIPEDSTLWSTAALNRDYQPTLVDPLIALFDLSRGTAADSADAVTHLREAIIAGKAR